MNVCAFLIVNILPKYRAPVYPSGIRDGVSTDLQILCDFRKPPEECYGSTEGRDTLRRLLEVFWVVIKQELFVLRTLVSSWWRGRRLTQGFAGAWTVSGNVCRRVSCGLKKKQEFGIYLSHVCCCNLRPNQSNLREKRFILAYNSRGGTRCDLTVPIV